MPVWIATTNFLPTGKFIMPALIIVAAVAGFVGIIIGYAVTPKITNAQLYQAYCKGKLSERQHKEKRLYAMQRRIWCLEAAVRKVGSNASTSIKQPVELAK